MRVYLILTLSFFLLYWLTPRKDLGRLFALFVLALAVMAFLVEPNQTDDLARYFQQIRNLKSGGWAYLMDCIRENTHGWGNAPVNAFYYYFISLLPSEHFLPAVTIFLSYGAMFHMLWLCARRMDAGKGILFAACFFLVGTYWFYDICSGIRNGLAFTLFGYFLYMELVERRHVRLCWLGYLLAVGLHMSALLLLALRLCVAVSGRNQKYAGLLAPLLALAILAGIPALEWLSSFVRSDYLTTILEKSDTYASGSGLAMLLEAGHMYYSNLATFLVGALLIIFFQKVILNSEEREQFRKFLTFLQFLIFLMLGAVATSMVFARLARWLLPQLTGIVLVAGMKLYQAKREEARAAGPGHTVIRAKRGYLRSKNQTMIYNLTILYSLLHYAYSMVGSSVIWMHF